MFDVTSNSRAAGSFGTFLEDYYGHAKDEAKKLTREGADLAKEYGVHPRGEVLDAPESVLEQIVGFAKNEKVDLTMAGTRGLSPFRKLVLGSVSSGIVTHAHCAVLVVR